MVLNGKRNPQNAEQVFRGALDKLISEKERDQKKNEISKNRLHTEEAGEGRGWIVKKELLILKKHFKTSNYKLKRSQTFYMSTFFKRSRTSIFYSFKLIYCKIMVRNNTEAAGEVKGWKRFVNTAKNRCARDAPVLCMCVRKQKTGFASSR